MNNKPMINKLYSIDYSNNSNIGNKQINCLNENGDKVAFEIFNKDLFLILSKPRARFINRQKYVYIKVLYKNKIGFLNQEWMNYAKSWDEQ